MQKNKATTKAVTFNIVLEVKMPEIKENFFENILFKFHSYACNCDIDVKHTIPGEEPEYNYKLTSLPNKPLLFGYAAKKGLVRIAPNGTIEESNILGALMSLANKDDNALKNFFSESGFLFPILDNEYEDLNNSDVIFVLKRLTSTVELMTAANEIKKDFHKIITLTFSLLFSQDLEIKTNGMSTPYKSCHYKYADLIKNPPTKMTGERNYERFDGKYFHVKDSIYGVFDYLTEDHACLMDNTDSTPGHRDDLYKNTSFMYINYYEDDINKDITDFLFHFTRKITPISCDGGIGFYNDFTESQLDSRMKESILKIARYVIGEEINANLYGIHPIYDSEKMTPSWKVDSLLCAAYFSIFYLKPDLELYRPCGNPRCGKYFLVKTTSTRNRFCSQECCNRVTQDRYRKRKREKENSMHQKRTDTI